VSSTRHDHDAHEASRHGHARSPAWHRVERAHLASHPRCVCCADGQSVGEPVQVHHIFPFHYCVALGRPDLELDDRNLITLCESEKGRHAPNHHLLIGHLDSFQSSNLHLMHDATHVFHGLDEPQIKSSTHYQHMMKHRLKPLDKLSDDEKNAFVQAMNHRFPKR
jgi:hypothetical protein